MSHGTKSRILITLSVALGLVWLAGPHPQAISGITFGHHNGVPWPAGPDFASDVLGDAWDFNNLDDVDRDPQTTQGWSTFSVDTASGVAGGTSSTSYTTMGILYSGYYGAINPGRNGRRLPVDPSRYQKFSFRMTAGSAGGAPQVYWFHYPWQDPRDPATGGYGVKQLGANVAGAQIYATDLTQSLTAGKTWTDSSVVGLRITRVGISAGQSTTYDWARLTVKDSDPSAALQSISWGGTTATSVDVLDAAGTAFRIATSTTSVSTWNYGVLPPGTYTMRVTLSGGGGTLTQPFTINAPPMIAMTDPNETGGADYATTVLNNAWDMDSAADVQITNAENFTPVPPIFSGGQLTATNTNNGPNVMLLYYTNDSVPIDTTRYRYFTVRYQIDGAFDLGEGSVGRVLWSTAPFDGFSATTSKPFIAWAGMNSYTIDLGSLTTAQDDGLETSGAPQTWLSGQKYYFNFHPHEFWDPRTFHIDEIKLAAIAETSNGGFTLKWAGSDANGGNPTVTLYYDTDTDPSNGKTMIAGGISMTAGQYFWNTGGVPGGDYWIYAEANDGTQAYGRYSTGRLRVLSGAAASNPAMALDTPSNGSSVLQPIGIGGWAIDRAATSGTGIDAVHVYAQPSGGSTPTFLGVATLAVPRADVGAVFGSQFANSGYNFSMTGLAPGAYTLMVFAHSTVTGTFNQARTVSVTIPSSQPRMAVEVPADRATVGAGFTVSGWAIDQASSTGPGVDFLDTWAYPIAGLGGAITGAPVSLGRTFGGISRPDVGAVFGSGFTNSGYRFTAATLPAGTWRLVVYGHSSVAGSFNQSRSADVTVAAPVSNPAMALDTPANGTTITTPSFTVAGWAIDRGALTGTGAGPVHIWAIPVNGGSQVFLGVATYGIPRPDVGAVFGGQFTNSGYTLTASRSSLTSGASYDIYAFAFSTVAGSGAPNQARVVRVSIP